MDDKNERKRSLNGIKFIVYLSGEWHSIKEEKKKQSKFASAMYTIEEPVARMSRAVK